MVCQDTDIPHNKIYYSRDYQDADKRIGGSTMRVQEPDFVALRWRNKEAGRRFYGEIGGLEPAPASPPDAFVFDTRPTAFAVREPLVDLDLAELRGHGGAFRLLAFRLLTDNTEELLKHLEAHGVEIVQGLGAGPFGKAFAAILKDTSTVNDKGQS